MTENKMPLNKAILCILVSTLLISGSSFMGWLYYLHVKERRLSDRQYRIVAIIQRTSQTERLKTVYLAQLLNIAIDQQKNLYQFNANEGTQTLLRDPLIKRAHIEKVFPGTLLIDYQLKTPTAFLGDFCNTALDEEGYLFPFHPFFTPKRLPVIYLGLNEPCKWGACLKQNASFQLAMQLLKQSKVLCREKFEVKQIDVAQAYDESFGQRQIVLVLEKKENEEKESDLLYVRLNPENFANDLNNLCTWLAFQYNNGKGENQIKNQKNHNTTIIDLRIPQLAFIK